MTFFIRLRDYYQRIANDLENEVLGSNIFANNSDVGASRENLLANFYRKHLPSRCNVITGGFIFDSVGTESGQIDVIITNDITLQFKQYDTGTGEGKSFNLVDGCYAAISVKSSLTKAALFDALNNLASIPAMPSMQGRINPMLQKTDLNVTKLLFAFDGLSLDTTMQHIFDFYTTNDIPTDRRADIIIVNNKFIIYRVGKNGGVTKDGEDVKPGSFHGASGDYTGAYALLYTLVRIQQQSVIGSQIIMDFGSIYDQIIALP